MQKNMFDIITISYHVIQSEMYAIKLDDDSAKYVRDIDKILLLGELSMSMRSIKTYSKKLSEDRIMEKVYSSDLSQNVIKVLFERNKLSHQQLVDAVGKKKSGIH